MIIFASNARPIELVSQQHKSNNTKATAQKQQHKSNSTKATTQKQQHKSNSTKATAQKQQHKSNTKATQKHQQRETMSDVPQSWRDMVAALASIPKDDDRNLLRKYVKKVMESETTFTLLGKNACKFFNAVVLMICKILIMARLEHGGLQRLDYRPWLKEFFDNNNISVLPFDVHDIAVQFKALNEAELRMESSEYAAEFALSHEQMTQALVEKLVEKLVKDMIASPYFKELFNRLVEEAN